MRMPLVRKAVVHVGYWYPTEVRGSLNKLEPSFLKPVNPTAAEAPNPELEDPEPV